MNPEILQAQIHIHNDTAIKGFFNTRLSNDRWLSNMQETKIIWMNMEFNSTEAAYQASKAMSLKVAKMQKLIYLLMTRCLDLDIQMSNVRKCSVRRQTITGNVWVLAKLPNRKLN